MRFHPYLKRVYTFGEMQIEGAGSAIGCDLRRFHNSMG